jgi:hypothetical protein
MRFFILCSPMVFGSAGTGVCGMYSTFVLAGRTTTILRSQNPNSSRDPCGAGGAPAVSRNGPSDMPGILPIYCPPESFRLFSSVPVSSAENIASK